VRHWRRGSSDAGGHWVLLPRAETSEAALNGLEKLSGSGYDGMLGRIVIRMLNAERASCGLNFRNAGQPDALA
jgi:hypothetical protein